MPPVSFDDTPKRYVPVNGPTAVVFDRNALHLMLSESVASTESGSDERIEIVRSVGNPFFFQIRGEKLTANIDISGAIQEAILHVLKENSLPVADPAEVG